ncbi:hypothetical protein EXIGLDRAFT_723493 [Exidia glandulosa HHB12029]|uniref:Fungal-type protein kinase domain-containing protein n=1 Tax=Exidia glandulosa HHB12029 TaxID=1314781 RepID=A0A165ETH6_EXIGL|nr:hypothetical protein EXIGLDRAFT_723493 [Exidia glandulosa HHB12029]
MAESPACPSAQLQVLDASKVQHVDPKDAPAWNISPYVADILNSSACDSLWTAMEADVAVTSAHRELASPRQSNDKQPYATFLLNALSLLASTSASPGARDDDHAILFDSAAHHIARGDFRGDACTPDWVAVQVPLHELRQAVRDTTAVVEAGSDVAVKALSAPQGWPRILAVGLVEEVRANRQRDYDSDDSDEEHEEEEDKLRTILTTLKAYHSDLLSVHGCELNASGRLRLAHVDAHAFVASAHNDCHEDRESTLREQLSPWLAHILSIQRTVATRDKTITARFPSLEDDFVRYDVTLGSRTVCVTPAAASRPPGRMTWVGFEVGGDANVPSSVRSENSLGVVKLSYQPQLKDGRLMEGEVLDLVHVDGWLPGVVRHTYWERNKAQNVVDTADHRSPHLVREKDMIHMASVGDPLSQCRTPLQMLKVAYDATETHLQLLNRGIIHRDFSWYNILCNPRHDPKTLATKQALTGIPCIDYILTGDKSKEPCCLIVDFDHAARYPLEIKEVVGTPMFIAYELSIKMRERRHSSDYLTSCLPEFLGGMEDLPIFHRAFPDDDGTFLETLTAIVALEEERRRLMFLSRSGRGTIDPSMEYTDPKDVVHDPCYDVQSIYWVLIWFFTLAQPAGASPGNHNAAFSTFVSSMLDHKIGHDFYRNRYLFGGDAGGEPHPRLDHFRLLFDRIAAYLAVPWHMYKDHPKLKSPLRPDHAHIAMRRFLLREIYELTTTETVRQFDLPLDPSRPRSIFEIRQYVYSRKRGWTLKPIFAAKRKADEVEDDDNVDTGSSKRQKLDISVDEEDLSKVDAESRTVIQAENTSSAAARCEKIRDDRWLFFGIGSRQS